MSRPPESRAGLRRRLRTTPPAFLALVSHAILFWILLVWLAFPLLFQEDEEELEFPIQIHIASVEGNTDDEQADDALDPAEEAAAPTVEEVPMEEERKRDVEEKPTEEITIGYGEEGDEAVEEQPPVQEDLDEQDVLDALEKVQRLATREAPAFSTRNADGRANGIGKYGGSAATESAVELGLAWLSAHQSADGRWDSNHFNRLCPSSDRCSGSGLMSYDQGQTGLALLAFLGAGYQPGRGTYGTQVSRGIEFLLAEQKEDGLIGNKDLYNHTIAVFALSEAYGMTRDRRLRKSVQSGVRYLITAQQPSGGWSYTAAPREERNDSSITGFAVMALKAAHVSGIHVPDEGFEGAIRHFRRMTKPETGAVVYADRGPQNAREGEGLVAVGLLTRLLLAQEADDPTVQRAIARVASNPPMWARRQSIDNSEYYWYYGTLAMFHAGGRPWEEWNRAMVRCLVPNQSRAGHRAGSWEPDTKWGPNGGRIYTTAINVLTLEIYYKYAPGYLKEMPDLARFWYAPMEGLQSRLESGRGSPPGDSE